MDNDCNYKGFDFVDYGTLPEEEAKKLFDIIYPDFPYGKNEHPWKESLRTEKSLKNFPHTNANNNNNDVAEAHQSASSRQGTFPETIPIGNLQTYPAVPTLEMSTKAQIPPPFMSTATSRTLPHNISQFTQQPAPLPFYGRPPFPVVSSTFPLHGQEMIALHHQQSQGYSEAGLYDRQPENEPQPIVDRQQQHYKYRSDKQSGYVRKAKKPYYNVHYSHDELMMEGTVDAISGQATLVPFSNHFPAGISGPTGYPMQYIQHSFVPFMPYGASYVQQPGGMLDMSQASPDVVAFEPPMVGVPPPSQVAALDLSHQQQQPDTVTSVEDAIVPCSQQVEVSLEKTWHDDKVPSVTEDTQDLHQEEMTLEEATAALEICASKEDEEEDEEEQEEEEEVEEHEEVTVQDDLIGPAKSNSVEEESFVSSPEVLTEAEPTPTVTETVDKSPPPPPPPAAKPVVINAWGSGKSWAGLFKSEGSQATDCTPNKVQETAHSGEEENSSDDTQVDCLLQKLGKFVQQLKLDFTTRPFQPRGLINRSNWCYINATLQALLVCPALYNMLKQLQDIVCHRNKSSTPIMDSLVELAKEFTPLNNISKKKEDFSIGPPLEPVCIHKMLSLIKSECVKGRQEDAEEFLSCILNGLHEEMVSLTKATALNNGTCNGEVETNGRVDGSEDDEDEDSWKVMGVKKRGMVTRSDQVSGSLVKDLFGGQTRSVLTAGSECSAVLQPFFTLQLDIQTNGESVSESLSQLTVKEPIHGYQCPRSKKEVEACRRTTLEELPPVLILHFKRFIYDDKDGGSKKVLKRTDYPLELELKTELLSPEVKKKYLGKQSRTYKLFAVVYHDGKEAVKGHYIADIFYPGSGNWYRCDDRNIVQTTEANVLAFNSPCVPYLLFYSRTDLQHTSASK